MHFVAPGKLLQKGTSVDLNGCILNGFVDETLFFRLGRDHSPTAYGSGNYNHTHPHVALGYQAIATCAAHRFTRSKESISAPDSNFR